MFFKLIETGFDFVTGEYQDGGSSLESENRKTLPKRKSYHLRLCNTNVEISTETPLLFHNL
jgi:hypothetical protein